MKTPADPPRPALDTDTPSLRLLRLLEVVAGKDAPFALQDVVNDIGLPKPTVHRMLQQFEAVGFLQREGARGYSTGQRLLQLAEHILLHSTMHGARHRVLRKLVEEIGESCNLTAFSGSEVLYLDRVETAAPLRFYLHPGSRVPAHCSATGKLFLGQMRAAQRRKLIESVPLERYTANTITSADALEGEIERAREQGYAVDNEEFLPGLVCLAVLVPAGKGMASNMGLALQAPVMRMGIARALQHLPRLQEAASALARINEDGGLRPGDDDE